MEMEVLLPRSARLRRTGERRMTLESTFSKLELELLTISSRRFVDASPWAAVMARRAELVVDIFELVE